MWEWDISFPKRTCMGAIVITLLALAIMRWFSPLPPSFVTARSRWKAQHIRAYYIQLTFSSGIASRNINLTVRDGRIERIRCSTHPPSKCKNAHDFLVPGLFDHAAATLRQSRDAYVDVTFDSVYGIPTLMTYDDPNGHDEETEVRVSSFEPLP
jgi:hypothetical protein